MRGKWGILSKAGALVLLFGGTVRAVDKLRCHDTFTVVVVDAAVDSRVKAYVEPMRETKIALKHKPIKAESLREICDMWIESSKKGKISQVYPGYYGESLVEGPKSDIFCTLTGLANKISVLADSEDSVDDPAALNDAIRAMELIEIVRFGSYEALFTSAGYLRRPQRILKPKLNSLTQKQRERLTAIQGPEIRKKKTELLDQVVHRLKMQYASRYGSELTHEDDPTYGKFVKANGEHVAAEHFFGFDREIGMQASLKK